MTHIVATPAAPRTPGRPRTALVAVATTVALALTASVPAASASAAETGGAPSVTQQDAGPSAGVPNSLTVRTRPTISGQPRVGSSIDFRRTSVAQSVDDRHRSIVWLVDDEPVSTASRYWPSAADIGKTITVRETITSPGYSTLVATTDPATIAKGTLNREVRLTAWRDAATVGGSVYLWYQRPPTAIAGERLSIVWTIGGVEIPATLQPTSTYVTYSPRPADLGKELWGTATFTAPGYDDLVIRTPSLTVSAGSITTANPPEITGKAVVGSTLTGTVGDWYPDGGTDGDLTYATQWLRDGQPIAGTSLTGLAMRSTYTLTPDDEGTDIRFEVTASDLGHTPKTATSASVRVSLPTIERRTAPSITGTARLGERLTATAGTWSPAPSRTSFQWLRDGKAITGATSATYTATTIDVGRTLAVQVAVEAAGHLGASATSATVTVVQGTLRATVQPRVSGAASVGKRLTATPGTWSTPGATFTYQWLRSGTAVAGATGTTYAVTKADIGSTLTVRVTATAPGRATATATSAASAKVAKVTPRLTLTAPTRVKAGARAKLTIKVAATTITKRPVGKVTITWGSGKKKQSKTLTLKASHTGKVTYRLPTLRKGKYKITVRYTPTKAQGTHLTTTSRTRTLTAR